MTIDVPFPFRAIPVQMIESNGARVLEQILMVMLPRFMAQVCVINIVFVFGAMLPRHSL